MLENDSRDFIRGSDFPRFSKKIQLLQIFFLMMLLSHTYEQEILHWKQKILLINFYGVFFNPKILILY